MSAPKVPLGVGEYVKELRAYHLRLAAFLGVDPSLAFDMRDEDVWEMNQATGPSVDVRWKTLDQPHPAEVHEGRAPMALGIVSDGETVVLTNGVHLDAQEADRARKEVGPRPEMFTPEQSLMLDGLRWRAEQQKRRP